MEILGVVLEDAQQKDDFWQTKAVNLSQSDECGLVLLKLAESWL